MAQKRFLIDAGFETNADSKITGNLDMTNGTVLNVAAPTLAHHVATKFYVDEAVIDLLGTAPDALNTLNELAAALGDDADFSSTVATQLGLKASITYVDSAISAATPSFATLTGKPTTLAGYGITDSITSSDVTAQIDAATPSFSTLTGKPTTVAGYGITDGITASAVTTQVDAAQAAAISAAATDASTKADAALASAQTYADTAEADAVASAASDATTKADAAQSAAASDATTKANAAQSAASSDATTKANAAQSAAASDATTKADAAQSAAISAAASDATTKANAAQVAAIAQLAHFHSSVQTVTSGQETTNVTATVGFTFSELSDAKHYVVLVNRLVLRPDEYSVSGSVVTIVVGVIAENDEIEVTGLSV